VHGLAGPSLEVVKAMKDRIERLALEPIDD